MTGNLSCQIAEWKEDIASESDKESSVLIQTVVGWTLSVLYITSVFSQSPWGANKIQPSLQSQAVS